MKDILIEDVIGSKVVGMRKEFVIGQETGAETFEVDPCEGVRYTIFCKRKVTDYWNQTFAITLEEGTGWCGSGYTGSSWGYMNISDDSHIGPITHVPVDENLLLVPSNKDSDYWNVDVCTNVFSYSEDGGDSYYPMGGINVHEELFKELPRAMKSRPRYIFFGDSGLGKTTIAELIRGKEVYETDSSDTLPDVIWADIIVLGNKYKFTLDEIKAHMEGTDTDNIIMVGFIKED